MKTSIPGIVLILLPVVSLTIGNSQVIPVDDSDKLEDHKVTCLEALLPQILAIDPQAKQSREIQAGQLNLLVALANAVNATVAVMAEQQNSRTRAGEEPSPGVKQRIDRLQALSSKLNKLVAERLPPGEP